MKSYNPTTPMKSIREYVYSSQVKNRDQLTLKNLLDLDADYQKNLASYASQRLIKTAPRPHTMYGDRMRIKLIDENKNKKLQSETKMNRYTSGKILRSTSNNANTVNYAQQKKVTQEQKMKMKKAVGKISFLAEGNAMMNQDEELEAIFRFLECLSKIDNHYKDNFVYLSRRLEDFVYASHKEQLIENARSLTNIWKNQLLMNFVYRPNNNITYQKICQQLFSIFMALHTQMIQYQKSSQKSEQLYKQQLTQKQQTIIKLKRQLKYYCEHPSQDLYPYIRKLQRQNKENKKQIQSLLQIKDDNQYRIQIFENTNLLLAEQIQTLKTKIYQFQLAELSGANQIEKSSELREFQNNIQILKDMLEKSQLKMEGMKEEYDQVKAYNDQLLNERSILAKRAAVGYGQLTPRPKIQKIFNNNQLDYTKYFHTKQSYSTEQAVQVLIETLKLIPEKQLKLKKKKKKQEKQQKNVASQVLQQLDDTRQHINVTKISSDKVKQEYNRQLRQKEALERNRKKK